MGTLVKIKNAAAPTLKDISAETGLSRETISQILNTNRHYAHYNDDTRMKVVSVAKRLGYRPNSMARNIRNGKFGSVGFIYCSGKGYLPEPLMRGVQEEIARRKLNLVLNWITEDVLLKEDSLPGILAELMVDGLLIDYLFPPPERLMKIICQNKTHAILINAGVDTDCVRPDDRQAGRDATRHLIGLGHRRIAFVYLTADEENWYRPLPNSIPHYSAYHRHSGYCDAMSEAGLEARLILGDRNLWEMSHKRTGEPKDFTPWLFEKGRPSAIVVYPGDYALPTIFRSMDMMRLSVPKDLSIVIFSNIPCIYDGFSITTMVEPFYEVGLAAVDALMDKIEGKVKTQKVLKFPFKLVEGSSCAKN